MATTGSEILKITLAKIDKFYSKYLDNTKWNRIFRMALTNISEKKYLGQTTQKELDDLRFAVKANQVFPVNNSKISVTPFVIASITSLGLTLRIKTLTPHNLNFNDTITISGVSGITSIPAINNTWTVYSVVSPTEFDIVTTFNAGVYVPYSGTLSTDFIIGDYLHLLTVKCKNKEYLPKLKVARYRATQPPLVEFNLPTNLATDDVVEINNFPSGSLNGTYFYESVDDFRGRLWLNEDLTIPAVVTSSTFNGGDIYRIYYSYAEPVYSDRKISTFEYATHISPKVQVANGEMVFIPNTTEITIDYYARPTLFIDVSDTIVDYENIYPLKFIYRIIDEAINIYSMPSRDVLLEQMEVRNVTP
jgi:hypothetical protein